MVVHSIKDNKDNINEIGWAEQEASLQPRSYSLSKFERQRGEIIELWDVCNVPLVHRTYFFLLFKGDPSDTVYVEVECRRLSFLKDTFSHGGSMEDKNGTITEDSRYSLSFPTGRFILGTKYTHVRTNMKLELLITQRSTEAPHIDYYEYKRGVTNVCYNI